MKWEQTLGKESGLNKVNLNESREGVKVPNTSLGIPKQMSVTDGIPSYMTFYRRPGILD